MSDETDAFSKAFSDEEPEQPEDGAKTPDDKEPETPEEKDIEKEPEAEPEKDPVEEVEEDPQTPEPSAKEPISKEEFKGYTDERDKRQVAEDRIKVLESQLSTQNATREQARELPIRPDAFDDPDGARAFDDAKHAGDLLDAKLNWSEVLATKEHGVEKVKEAQAAFATLSPHEQQRIQSSQHPYQEIISSRENQGVLDQIAAAGGLDKLIEQKLAAKNDEVTEISKTIKEAVKPPPSLATGGHVKKGSVAKTGEEVFDDMFSK